LPGEVLIPIGIGGGSDCIQASVLAKLLINSGKTCPCVISIRGSKTQSQSSAGIMNEQRTVTNPEQQILEGVYLVNQNTTGSGRFLENIPTSDIPIVLILESDKVTLDAQIQSVINHFGNIDTIIGVDTGGDALYSQNNSQTDASKATPDQDLRSLKAMQKLKVPNLITAEICVGVDSPQNAEDVLLKSESRIYNLSPVEANLTLDTYRQWEMDGSREDRFGKTSLAWQSALRGEIGLTCLSIPNSLVTSKSNPWNPFVILNECSQSIFFSNLESHLEAISN
jgi:hypothetical protein